MSRCRYGDSGNSGLSEDTMTDYLGPVMRTDRAAQPLFTFIFDDGAEENYTEALPIFQARGSGFTAGIITGLIGTAGFMSWGQVNGLKAGGCELANHSIDNTRLIEGSPGNLTKEEIDSNIETAWQAIKTNTGVETQTLVYPGGASEVYTRQAVRKRHTQAISVGHGENQSFPMNQFNINRQDLDNVADLATAQGWVDDAIANNEWCVFMAHPGQPTWDDVLLILPDLLDYIITTKGYPVDNVNTAIEKCGNLLQLGDESSVDRQNDFRVWTDEDGLIKTKFSGKVNILADNEVDCDKATDNLDVFSENYDSYVCWQTYSTNGAPTTQPGVLITYRYSSTANLFFGMWQEWYSNVDRFTPYVRRFKGAGSGWGDWRKVASVQNHVEQTITTRTINAHTTYTKGDVYLVAPTVNNESNVIINCKDALEDGLVYDAYGDGGVWSIRITNTTASNIVMAQHVFVLRAIQ